ncbi:MAG: metallophosphoesterase family protein [Selenomonadaceae bacterium]|nr:metallophosphoesterase family protein [Selenomonadaceae bacterium]
MSFLEKFLAHFKHAQEFHAPQVGYKNLTAAKFFRQIVTADSRTSRTVMWNSPARLENVQLEYRMVGEDAASFAEVTADFFGGNFIYSSTLKNLKPESLYHYRLVAGEEATGWRNLRTAGDGEFEMLVFSDSQSFDYNTWHRTAEDALKNYPDAEIFAVNGDFTDNGQDFFQWREWYEEAENILRDRILVPVMGNHECYDENWRLCQPSGYLKNFALPSNGDKNFGGYFYAFDYGAAHFFVLNTQLNELGSFKAGLEETQAQWFRWNAATNRPWRIVFMHKSIYNRSLSGFVAEAENYFMRLFDELEIDLVLTGHLHTYMNAGKFFAQKKSERGTHYVLCGRSGDHRYNREPESYLALKVRADSLEITCRSAAGEIRDQFTLKKI